jgi:serine protease AprX
VIDTGIAGDLADFSDDDGSSRVIGSAVVNPDAHGAGDRFGHGTHVAGIIAGDGNRRRDRYVGRYVGIAPDADLVSIKIDDDEGRATVLDAIYGLQFAVDHKDEYGIRVVNLSLESSVAGSYQTDPLDAAVEAAWLHGIVVVAAAGNRGRDADAVHYAPGNDPFAITVGAVDDRGTRGIGDDQVAKWSSQGTTQDGFAKPELTAPGSQIVSTIAPDSAYVQQCESCVVEGGYFRAGGTSMSAPVVAGVAALVLQAHPNWTPDQVKYALMHSSRLLKSRIGEVNASAVLAPGTWRIPSANGGIAPSTLIDPASGDIDYSRSSWTRSSWTGAADGLAADWSRSSWTCLTCEAPDAAEGEANPVGGGIETGGGKADPARSSWTRSSWTAAWGL